MGGSVDLSGLIGWVDLSGWIGWVDLYLFGWIGVYAFLLSCA